MSGIDGLLPNRNPQDRFSLRRAFATFGAALAARWPWYLPTIALLGVVAPIALMLGVMNLVYDDAVGWSGPVAMVIGSLSIMAVDTLTFGLLIHLTLRAARPSGDAMVTAVGAAIMTFPAVFAVVLVMALPHLATLALTSLLLNRAQPGQAEMADIAWQISGLRVLSGAIAAGIGALLIAPKQVVMAEALGPIAAIRRSWALTRGKRRLFAVVGLTTSAIVGGADFAINLAKPWIAQGDPMSWRVVAFGFASKPLAFLGTIFFTAIYLELRRVERGRLGKIETASVFD